MPCGDELAVERCCHDCAVIKDVWSGPMGDHKVFSVTVPPLDRTIHVRAESPEAAMRRVVDTLSVASSWSV
jgi:hypothetical protein